MLSAKLLSAVDSGVLVCPETKRGLRCATGDEVRDILDGVASGSVECVGNYDGKYYIERYRVDTDVLLIRDDNEVAYPVIDGIPILLIEDRLILKLT